MEEDYAPDFYNGCNGELKIYGYKGNPDCPECTVFLKKDISVNGIHKTLFGSVQKSVEDPEQAGREIVMLADEYRTVLEDAGATRYIDNRPIHPTIFGYIPFRPIENPELHSRLLAVLESAPSRLRPVDKPIHEEQSHRRAKYKGPKKDKFCRKRDRNSIAKEDGANAYIRISSTQEYRAIYPKYPPVDPPSPDSVAETQNSLDGLLLSPPTIQRTSALRTSTNARKSSRNRNSPRTSGGIRR